jgi:hypothetical protein
MITALLVGAVLAVPVGLFIAFFRQHAKLMPIVRELQTKLHVQSVPILDSTPNVDSSPSPTSASPPHSLFPVAAVLAALAVLIIGIVILVPHSASVSQETASATDGGTGPGDIFNNLEDVQKKILRTMWDYQKQLSPGYEKRFIMRIYPETFEYLELYPHLDALVKRGYVICTYAVAKQGNVCVIDNGGITFMQSIGSLANGSTYVLPFDYVETLHHRN